MNQLKRDSQRRGTEFVLFLVASVIGIYGLGRGLTGMFEPGQGISLPWLAVTGVAFVVLFAQMGRVHDTWPRKPEKQDQPLAQQPPAPVEETSMLVAVIRKRESGPSTLPPKPW